MGNWRKSYGSPWSNRDIARFRREHELKWINSLRKKAR